MMQFYSYLYSLKEEKEAQMQVAPMHDRAKIQESLWQIERILQDSSEAPAAADGVVSKWEEALDSGDDIDMSEGIPEGVKKRLGIK